VSIDPERPEVTTVEYGLFAGLVALALVTGLVGLSMYLDPFLSQSR